MQPRRRLVLSLIVAGAATLIAAAFFLHKPIAHEWRYASLLHDLRKRDPVREAEAAWKRGDPRFIGIFGFGLSCPDVPEDLPEKYGVNPIQGTSDCLVGDRQAEFQVAAHEFASRYNREMLAQIQRAAK